jgi:hypothetical protein
MATPTSPRGFQAQNSCNNKPKKPASISFDEPEYSNRVPNTSIRTNSGTGSSLPSSPGGIIKPTPKRYSSMMPKRNSSSVSIGSLLPRRKSLQTTALATRRQSLWMNIAKNPLPNTGVIPSPLPLIPDPSNLMRKKILRLLLVFSYVLSISVLAIVLATFYGFFWSGYSTPQTTTVSDVKTHVRSLISSTSDSTLINRGLEIEHVS